MEFLKFRKTPLREWIFSISVYIVPASLLIIFFFFRLSSAQTISTIKPLQIKDLTTASSSNPGGNYPRTSAGEIQNDNYGISIFTGSFPTPYTECGTIGMPWNIFKTSDPSVANTWEKRNPCLGNVSVGVVGDIAEQVITLNGTTANDKSFSLDVYVPLMTRNETNMRIYIDDTGATYHCRADHDYSVFRYPSDCDLTLEQALVPAHLARAAKPAVCGNGLCQSSSEDSYSCSQDCGNPKTFAGSVSFQSGDAGGSVETNSLIKQKVINLRNNGSHPDVFRTTLPVNPENRCGLRPADGPYPENKLPNTLPATLDTPLAVNETKYIVAVCVTQGLPTAPFTWSYKTVSAGATTINRADVNSVFAEVSDTVTVNAPIACTDSDNGSNSSVKGTATGTYSGARPGYIAIYGQEPDPNTPKPTTEKFSTYIDHCSWDPSQLNEGFCTADGQLAAIGIKCPNGCKDGVCVSAVPPAPVAPGLIGHWKFDGNGTNDVAGRPNADIVGKTVFNSSGGKFGGYAYVSSGSDYLKIPYDSVYDLPDTFTIEFWFRQRSNQSFNQNLIYKGTPINNFNFNISRWLWNQYNFGPVIAGHTTVNTGYWTQASNPNQLPHNEWHHVAYTKNATSQTYYLDGELIHSKDFLQYPEYGGPAKTPHNDIIIGDSAVDTDFDNLKIYNIALTQEEILANNGFPPLPPKCIKLALSTNRVSYLTGDYVSYTTLCASSAASTPIIAAVLLTKPDGTVTTLSTPYNTNTLSQVNSFSTSGFAAGNYVLKACLDSACPASSATTVSFTITGTPVDAVPASTVILPSPLPYVPVAPTSADAMIGIAPVATSANVAPSVSSGPASNGVVGVNNANPNAVFDAACKTTQRNLDRTIEDTEKQLVRYEQTIPSSDAPKFMKEQKEKYQELKGRLIMVCQTQNISALEMIQREQIDIDGKLEKLYESSQQQQLASVAAQQLNILRDALDDTKRKSVNEKMQSLLREAEAAALKGDYDLSIRRSEEALASGSSSGPKISLGLETILENRFSQDVVDKIVNEVVDKLQDRVTALLDAQFQSVAAKITQLQKDTDVLSQSLANITLVQNPDEQKKFLASKEGVVNQTQELSDSLRNAKVRRGIKNELQNVMTESTKTNWTEDIGEEIEQGLVALTDKLRTGTLNAVDVGEFKNFLLSKANENQDQCYRDRICQFRDTPLHEWYFGPIEFNLENGYMKGYAGTGLFQPGKTMTWAEALAVAMKVFEVPLGPSDQLSQSLPGIPAWLIPYINGALQEKIDFDYSRPWNDPITRKDFAVMIVMVGREVIPAANRTTAVNQYRDMKKYRSDTDTVQAVEALVQNGVMKGNKGLFKPDKPLSRGEAAAINERLARNLNLGNL